MSVREIPETVAAGSAAAVYADIRRVFGVPFVPLVYRVLATQPRRLEAIWAELGPNLGSDDAQCAARTLNPPPAPGVAVQPVQHDGVTLDIDAAVATLQAFRHTNSLNIIGLAALLQGVEAAEPRGRTPSALRANESTLPMVDLQALPDSTLALLEEMSAAIVGTEQPIVIPSLLRCFAHDERLLTILWEAIRECVESPEFANRASAIEAKARTIATELPYRTTRLEHQETRQLVERFVGTISAMIVVGDLLEAVILDLASRRDSRELG